MTAGLDRWIQFTIRILLLDDTLIGRSRHSTMTIGDAVS